MKLIEQLTHRLNDLIHQRDEIRARLAETHHLHLTFDAETLNGYSTWLTTELNRSCVAIERLLKTMRYAKIADTYAPSSMPILTIDQAAAQVGLPVAEVAYRVLSGDIVGTYDPTLEATLVSPKAVHDYFVQKFDLE